MRSKRQIEIVLVEIVITLRLYYFNMEIANNILWHNFNMRIVTTLATLAQCNNSHLEITRGGGEMVLYPRYWKKIVRNLID